MMSHGMTLLTLTSITDEKWENALAPLLAIHSIRPSEGEDKYLVVVLDAKFCHIELYADARDKGLQFPNRFADDDSHLLLHNSGGGNGSGQQRAPSGNVQAK